MTPSAELHPLLQALKKTDYDIKSLDDEIRVDKLCVDLLRHLYQDLTRQTALAPEQAGERCHGADYFLREFVISDRQKNIFAVEASDIRQFAGHWYITHALEPDLTELKNILCGVSEFYAFLSRQGLVTGTAADDITSQCQNIDYYQQRIEDFWTIEGDGFIAWRLACPLTDQS
jgi:hypothetical protein